MNRFEYGSDNNNGHSKTTSTAVINKEKKQSTHSQCRKMRSLHEPGSIQHQTSKSKLSCKGKVAVFSTNIGRLTALQRRSFGHIYKHTVAISVFYFFMITFCGLALADNDFVKNYETTDNNKEFVRTGFNRLIRVKRQYYEDGYYGNYYGWQTGRLLGWLLGFIVLMTIICVPCICCIGIWFAGWFGLRQAMNSRRRNGPPPAAHHYPQSSALP